MHEIRKFFIVPNRRLTEYSLENPALTDAIVFLEIFLMCHELKTLPRSGGLLDQDSLFIFLMKYALLCQRERQELEERRRVRRNAT